MKSYLLILTALFSFSAFAQTLNLNVTGTSYQYRDQDVMNATLKIDGKESKSQIGCMEGTEVRTLIFISKNNNAYHLKFKSFIECRMALQCIVSKAADEVVILKLDILDGSVKAKLPESCQGENSL